MFDTDPTEYYKTHWPLGPSFIKQDTEVRSGPHLNTADNVVASTTGASVPYGTAIADVGQVLAAGLDFTVVRVG